MRYLCREAGEFKFSEFGTSNVIDIVKMVYAPELELKAVFLLPLTNFYLAQIMA